MLKLHVRPPKKEGHPPQGVFGTFPKYSFSNKYTIHMRTKMMPNLCKYHEVKLVRATVLHNFKS